MDEPPRKRRKTSSPAHERSSSPLKQRPRRPSFASPTKASLARFNPNLLPRPAVTGRATNGGGLVDRGTGARTLKRIGGDDQGTGEGLSEYTGAGGAEPGASRTKAHSTPPRPRQLDARTRASLPIESIEEEESELPGSSTPNNHSNRGALFSSPSKQPQRTGGMNGTTKAGPSKLGRKNQTANPVTPADNEIAEEAEAGLNANTTREPPDPELEHKKREKERLLREVQDLERDIAYCDLKIRDFQDQPATRAIGSYEQDELINFINKLSGADLAEEKARSPPVLNLLCSFLPFTAATVPSPAIESAPEKPIPSHRPVEVEDPLPYLQMFTSFNLTSQIQPVDPVPGSSDSQLHQRHIIAIEGPQKLLRSTVEVSINSSTQSVFDLQIPQLSGWAERELGAFVRRKAQEQDLSFVCWAFDSYWELSRKRAEYWHRCEAAFSHLIPGRSSEDTENTPLSNAKPSSKMKRRDLLRQLGRDILVLEDRHIYLKFTWRIEFDWTGEAQSILSLEPAFPRVWSEADESGNLKKIPETFNALVESRGVFEATKITLSLLFDA